jgi:RND family efflux transporter MFP subunit
MSDQSEKRADLSALRIDPSDRSVGGGGRKLWRWVALAAVVLGVLVVFGLMGGKAEVQVATARPMSGSEGLTVLNASGYVTPRRRATVAAKITGRVKEILVEEGMPVEEGQVLARLDDSDVQAAYAAAAANLDAAKAAIPGITANLQDAEATLARTKELQKSGFIDQQALDNALASRDSLKSQLAVSKAQLKAAEARIAVAQRDIDNYTVRAPFKGIAVSKDAQPGEMVSPISAGGGFTRTGISTVVDMASLEIEVDVNESYIAKVSPGQRVEAILDAYPDWKIPASVRTIIPTADRQKATVKVRISFDKLDPKILPDMGIKVAFLQGERPAGAPVPKCLVPREAVREEGGAKVVFVLKDGRLHRKTVSAGETHGTEMEILAGVDPGEQVVVAGPKGLKDGQKAAVKKGS